MHPQNPPDPFMSPNATFSRFPWSFPNRSQSYEAPLGSAEKKRGIYDSWFINCAFGFVIRAHRFAIRGHKDRSYFFSILLCACLYIQLLESISFCFLSRVDHLGSAGSFSLLKREFFLPTVISAAHRYHRVIKQLV